MILDSSTRSLQIKLGEAMVTTHCDIVVCWAATSAAVFAPAADQTASNGTTAVTVVAGPTDGTVRQVSEVRLFNNDTVTHLVTLQLLDGAQVRIIRKLSVLTGEHFVYTPAVT
jgi:hypothetical protein